MKEKYPPRERIIRLVLLLISRPRIYTKRQLAEKFNCNPDTIKGDFNAINSAGLTVAHEKYLYYIVEDKGYKQFKDLLHFTEEDQFLLFQAIDHIAVHGKRAEILKKKLASLYDYKQLGHAYLRKPYLRKVDDLLRAKKEKKRVILKNYTSSSGDNISDKTVEVFHIDPAADTIQAFDVLKKASRHYRISRFSGVELTDVDWEYEQRLIPQLTDPFRIVNNDQIPVHIRMRTGAYNELKERFPLTKGYIEKDGNVYDFHCNVNNKFIGLTNFILSCHHEPVEVVFPDILREHLNNEVKKLKF